MAKDSRKSVFLPELVQRLDLVDLILMVVPLLFALAMIIPGIRQITTPFILGAVFAYILSPLVTFATTKLRLPRIAAIALIFLIFAVLISILLGYAIRAFNQDFRGLIDLSGQFNRFTQTDLKKLPDWAQDLFVFFEEPIRNLTLLSKKGNITMPFLRDTVGTVIHFFAFLISALYFLKDGETFNRQISQWTVFNRIESTIKNYFRGQMILILLMTAMTWLFLSVLQVKFAFLLSAFTGVAEIVPLAGPVAAQIVIISTVLVTNHDIVLGSSLITSFLVFMVMSFFRQLEDLFVIPYVLGKSVKMHPLMVLFITLLAGKLYGFIGLVFGVPFAAMYNSILTHIYETKLSNK